MPITRTKASQLLNQREMALYDDSRVNALRQLDGKALATRVTRARAARDRARDLVRRQKLASRSSTGSKRGNSGDANQRSKDKVELMADILDRFETKLREAERQARATGGTTAKAGKARKAGAAKPARTAKTAKAAKAADTSKTSKTAKTAKAAKTAKQPARPITRDASDGATATARRRSAGAKQATTNAAPREDAGRTRTPRVTSETGRRKDGVAPHSATASDAQRASREPNDAADAQQSAAPASREAARRRAAPSSTAHRAPGRRTRRRRLTPEEALAQTQALLEAKQARDAEPKPWAEPGSGGTDPGAPGYQSASAARRAKRLHAAEIRLPANQGSVSTRDRVNQGKRDHRGRTDD